MDAREIDDLVKRRRAFGIAVGGALILKLVFYTIGRSADSFSDTAITVLQVLSLLGSIAVFFWLARTAFLCAAALGWATWKCWCIAIACGVLQWVAWVMYFVFRSQVAKKTAARPLPTPNGALGADSTSSDVLASAEWLLGALRGEAVLDGESLTTEELRMLRTPVSELSSRNVDRELLQALNDRVVRLARSAIERANRLAKPTVTARPGLRIPADWDRHYKVIFTGNIAAKITS